ncbi:unnamed protein product [Pocillopora meandrina]|uniref:Uncharacterized protein n=1 Tax=Pocillopora meandrina TaxID=46732 RepID=A0AAU9W6Q2_9CNID|nr:unnamed protein product [Pocillopora meandrina]
MKPFLITVLILVAIAAATGTPKKYERRPMNHFCKENFRNKLMDYILNHEVTN